MTNQNEESNSKMSNSKVDKCTKTKQNEESNSKSGKCTKTKEWWGWSSIYKDPIPTATLLITIIALLFGIVIGLLTYTSLNLYSHYKTVKDKLEKRTNVLENKIDKKLGEAHNNIANHLKTEKEKIDTKLGEVHSTINELIKGEQEKIIQLSKLTTDLTTELILSHYSNLIEMEATVLAKHDVGQKTAAIWRLVNILNTIKEKYSKLTLYGDISCEYEKVLRYLKLNISKENFDDSYRGRVWIWIMLIETQNDCIMKLIRKEIFKNKDLILNVLDEFGKLRTEKPIDFSKSIERLQKYIIDIASK